MTRENVFERRRRIGIWIILFISNLTVPFPFGILVAESDIARIGMIFAILMFGFFGTILYGFNFRIGRSLAVGAIFTSCMQLTFVPHVALGIFSIAEVKYITEFFAFDFNLKSIYGPFVVTMVMGFHLTTIAILFGATYRWFADDRPIWWNKSNSADPDME